MKKLIIFILLVLTAQFIYAWQPEIEINEFTDEAKILYWYLFNSNSKQRWRFIYGDIYWGGTLDSKMNIALENGINGETPSIIHSCQYRVDGSPPRDCDLEYEIE